MNGESANKFISALVKSLQTLCHGYVDFNDGIEIIGHLYLNIDSGPSFDYIVKEKVCKNAESGTIFVSKSFQAHSPPGEVISRRDKDDEIVFDDSSMSPTTGTHRIQSAITNISNVLSGHPGQKAHPSHHSQAGTGKRKREHGGSYNIQPGYKYTTLQSSSSPGFFSSASSSKQGERSHPEQFSNSSHAEFFGGDSNQGSGMGADDEDDLDLDVTFVKEEYQRNSGQRVASRLSQDQGSSQSNVLHDGQLSYPPNHSQAPQQFASGTAGDLSGIGQNFQDPSQLELGQQAAQGPPNPRSDASPGEQTDLLCDHSSLPLIREQMKEASDTLQLGIRLFGPKFVEDISLGQLKEEPKTPDPIDNQPKKQSNLSVFPDMFVASSLQCTWQNKEEEYKTKSYPVSQSMNSSSSQEKIQTPNTKDHLLTGPFKRKRGRPRKTNTPFEEPLVISPKSRLGNKELKIEVVTKVHDIVNRGAGLRRVRGSYRQYTPADKLTIINFGIEHGSTAASRKYNIPESTVRSWSKKKERFQQLLRESLESGKEIPK
ncbi:hypothetical protein ElyMa_006651700 [Elysia marginata]|uniref:HTH psq-type domain-containing protein n=1 Tax=Elysia marginata TaxID=1093978 RepID=A0AAV4IMN4_9GAST|nr:hypothetical protein ElyMa_006651700 [Elysia marginata]